MRIGPEKEGTGGCARVYRTAAAAVAGVLLLCSGSVGAYELTRPGGDPTEAPLVVAPHVIVPPLVTASPSPVPTPSPIPTPFFDGQPFRIRIDKIGVYAPVVTEGLDKDDVPEVPLDSYDVAWYDFTAQPGIAGNTVFAAHKTWNGPAVFYDLDKLAPGDVIFLEGANGGQLTYKITDSFTVNAADPAAVAVMSPSTRDELTLISCDGTRFLTDDPVFGADYTERRVVRAERTGMPLAFAIPATG